MLCCCAPLAYMVTKTLSSYLSIFRGKAIQLLLLRHSWCGCVTLLFPPVEARASCCACDSALGLARWAALSAPLHLTCPSFGRSDSCMVGVRRGIATSTHVSSAIPGPPGTPLRGLLGPALARKGVHPRIIESGASGRQLFLDDPARGASRQGTAQARGSSPPPAKQTKKAQTEASNANVGWGGGAAPAPTQDAQQQGNTRHPKEQHVTKHCRASMQGTAQAPGSSLPPHKANQKSAGGSHQGSSRGGGRHHHQQKMLNNKGKRATKRNSTAHNTAGRAGKAPHRHGAAAPSPRKQTKKAQAEAAKAKAGWGGGSTTTNTRRATTREHSPPKGIARHQTAQGEQAGHRTGTGQQLPHPPNKANQKSAGRSHQGDGRGGGGTTTNRRRTTTTEHRPTKGTARDATPQGKQAGRHTGTEQRPPPPQKNRGTLTKRRQKKKRKKTKKTEKEGFGGGDEREGGKRNRKAPGPRAPKVGKHKKPETTGGRATKKKQKTTKQKQKKRKQAEKKTKIQQDKGNPSLEAAEQTRRTKQPEER